MVAGTDADVVGIEHLGHVVGVDVAVHQRHHSTAFGGLGGAVDGQLVAVAFGEGSEGVGGEGDFVLSHRFHAQRVEVVDGCAQADGFADHGCACLELPWQLVGGEALLGDLEDHLAAAEEGGHGFEELGSGPQHADTHRTQHLVTREGDEVGAHGPVSYTHLTLPTS